MAKALSTLPVGALVKDTGTLYNGKPIIWKIADINHTGYPSGAVTLITERIISLKCFDAREPSNSDSNRRTYGNNRWIYSNIRQWLNSQARAGAWYAAQHGQDAPPNNANVWSNYNEYEQEAGFLAGFSANFLAALLTTNRTVGKAQIDGGGTETCTDKIFFATSTEVGLSGDVTAGSKLALFSNDASRLAYPTAEAVSKSEYTSSSLSASDPWHWWLADAYASDSYSVRDVNSSGAMIWGYAYVGDWGVRPLCNIKSEILVSDSPNSDGAYTIIWNRAPSVPESIDVPSEVRGGENLTVTWFTSSDPDGNLSGYILERRFDSGSWTRLYKGSSRSYTDSIPNNQHTTVTYRVKAYDSNNAESGYTTSTPTTIINNTAPGTPGSITIPSTILADKSFQISWGASTDTDGNLTGYKLERSINSGSTWQQVYQGPATSYTDTVPNGTPSVTYRVKAYDSYNAESGYKTSNTVGVINNRPPESPASITLPEIVFGGRESVISWTASKDEDQNLVGYELERQLNNTGGFTRIYKGSELQYTDTIEKGTLQVRYRVRAYDSYNAYSPYTTSTLKEVNNNTLPTITGEDTDLGTLESVSYRYTVTDPDEGQTLNVTEYIDSKIHRTLTVTSGIENTLTVDGEEFLQVGKGSHTIVISVDDGQGILVKRTLTFTRVQNKLSTTLITPLPANEMPTRMYAFIIGNIPTEAVFHFYACNNAFDVEPTWQEVTDEVLMKKKFYFTNKTKTAEKWGVNIKFEVDRSTVPEDTEIYISKVTGGFDGYSTQS